MKLKSLLSWMALWLLGATAFMSCDSEGNKYEGHGTYACFTSMPDSMDILSNYDIIKEMDSVKYRNDIVINSLFRLSHYCESRKFVAGITVTNMKDLDTAAPTNYSSIVGHGSLAHSNGETYNQSCFIADLKERCTIVFDSAQLFYPLKPQSMYVTNAAYSYLCMKNGAGEYPKFGTDDFLKLRIRGLNRSGSSSTRYVDVYLADNGNILDEWKQVDLTPIGETYGLTFTLETADGRINSQISLPPLFCFDALIADYSYSISY